MFSDPKAKAFSGGEGIPVRIRHEQVELLYEALPVSLLAVIINATILVLVQSYAVPFPGLIAWYVATLFICLGRGLLYLRYRHRNILFEPAAVWLQRFNVGVVLSAVGWGASAVLLFPSNNPIHQMFLLFVIAGMSAGAVTTLSASLASVNLFLSYTLAPILLRLLFDEGDLNLLMAVMTLMFIIMVSLSARRSYHSVAHSLRSRFAHEEALSELQASTEHNRLLLESVGEGIYGTDMAGITTFVNPAAASMLGYKPEELIGKPMHTMIHFHRADGSHYPREECPMNDTIMTGRSRLVADEVLWRKDGMPLPVEYRSTPIVKDGGIAGAVVTFSDISARKVAEEKLERQAFYDVLTDLPNRRLLLDRLEQANVRAQRHVHMGALLFLDLDHFKTINDSLGHPVGDLLLKQVASRLRNLVRQEDTAARMGGDEFVVLFAEVSNDPDSTVNFVQQAAEKIQRRLSDSFTIDGQVLHVTPSIGVALFPMNNESADDVLKQADAAMYRSKELGRNSIQFFLPSMQLAVEERLTLQNDLRYAIEYDQFQLLYQPQYEHDGHIIGAEALLRWRHPDKGLVSPDDFIPVAEDTGLILEIGEWVLLSSCQLLRALSGTDGAGALPYVAVNVSPRQFRQADFVPRVEQILQQTGVDGSRLELELTEGMLLNEIDEAINKIRQLKAFGVRVSIDDFGTGYSSLAYLKDLPLNKLKIDKSFIQDIHTDSGGAAIVETIIAMASHLGLDVIAEGVENKEQLAFLQDRGCHTYQGYYFCRPVEQEALLTLLQQQGEVTDR